MRGGDRARQELAIAEAQLRDYQARFGATFAHDAYLTELTALRDALRAWLSSASPAPDADTGPTMLELADRITVLRTAQTIDAMPQRTDTRGGSMADERIRRRIERTLID